MATKYLQYFVHVDLNLRGLRSISHGCISNKLWELIDKV